MQRGKEGQIKSSITSKNRIFAMPGFAAGGTGSKNKTNATQ